MLRAVFAALLLVGGHTTAQAQYLESGSSLLQHCRNSTGSFLDGVCAGFILGVADALASPGGVFGFRACRPPAATRGQLTEIVVKHLQGNPQQWHLSGASIAAQALARAFPCRR